MIKFESEPQIKRHFDCSNCGLITVSFWAGNTPRCPQCNSFRLKRDEVYEHAAELLANLTRAPIVSELTYETLDAIITVCQRAERQ